MNLNAVNTFTAPVLVQAGDVFDVSISGSFIGTVTVQRSKDSATWLNVENFTEPVEKTGVGGSSWFYRVGFTAYTWGTAVAEIYV